jgi:hypothetical protein
VVETLKGDSLVSRLFFLAQPTWICDVTEAEAGETALLFLERSNGVLELLNMPPGMASSGMRLVASGGSSIGFAEARPFS